MVQQSAQCFDPVPDPVASGWTQEGNQPNQGPSSPLIVRDPSNQPNEFINFFCAGDDPAFAKEIILTPRLSVDAGFQADANANIGVHVTINGGVNEVRAMLFDAGGGRCKVALISLDGTPTNGFVFPGLTADFTLKRRLDGTGVLSVPSSGQPDQELPAGQQAPSSRPGTKSFEFGSHKDYPGSSTSRWTTLGLPHQFFDPVPNPTAAGWTVEENGGSDVQEGTEQLTIVDPSAAGGVFANVRVADDAIFQQEISLTPHFTIDAAYIKDPGDESLGVHVTINDGVKMIRALIVEDGAVGKFKVALVSPLSQSGFSNGFGFIGATADFTLKRLADGTGVLQVPNPVAGEPPLTELQPRVQQPESDRANIKTLEFGTLNVPTQTTTIWDTLGLQRKPEEFPVGLTARQVRIRDDNDDRVRFVGNFKLAPGQTIDPVTEQVTLRFSTGPTVYFSVELPPGSFERRQNSTPARWTLTGAARNTFNLERFDILEGDGSIHFVDRGTAALVWADYTNTKIEFAVGNNRGSIDVVLEERPPDSGSWRLDR